MPHYLTAMTSPVADTPDKTTKDCRK